ncbi:GbsR/MarR family transcriptional regulator [Amycolatopsis sp. lyj-112]|uniref:GbsR/MarR family transcriptional regulator n=1 Tax=Amycolatopsis sp. lyj-112 TaxID=2789288 RepID=UPI00397B170C
MSDTARPPAAELLLDNFATVIGQTMGWPPMAGLTAGVLLLSAEPMTVQELQDELGASAGSVSEMTRLLIANGVVRRFKASGTRHFVYEWRPDAWAGCLEHQLRQTERLRDLAHDAVEQGRTFDEPQRRRLRAMADYYDFMVTRLDSLLEVYRGELRTPDPKRRT